MTIIQAAAVLISLTALLGYVNERFIKLPTPIGVMLTALALSLGLLVFGTPGASQWAQTFLDNLNFNSLVMDGLLSFLLFAGALTVNLDDLNEQKWPVLTLATFGILLSTFLVGTLIYYALMLFGLNLPYIYALLFGALISPTDPIAVLGILKKLSVPKRIETLITGESLFNDGVGVVVFSVLLSFVEEGGGQPSVGSVALLFAEEAVGGILFGLVLGYVTYQLLKRVNNYSVEVLLTLAAVMGGYTLAQVIHTSGPLAMVVVGLFIGNRGRLFAMSETTREHLDTFWEMVDEVLNAVLFALIGLELLAVRFSGLNLAAALVAVPIALLSRTVSVGGPMNLFRIRQNYAPYTIRMMVWGGLKGGISIALALSLPEGDERNLIEVMTYGVVVFTILVQGLTVERVAKRMIEQQVSSGHERSQ